MRIGICDDEKELRTSLRRVIERVAQLDGLEYKVSEYGSGEEILKELKADAPELLFLDIEMDGIDGMEAARAIRKTHKDMVIIFVTAYPDFVFQGYEVHAFHYILKPYKEEKIKEVFRKALEELNLQAEQYYAVEQKSGTLRLRLKEVRYFQSDRKKVIAETEDGKIEFYGKLNDIETALPGYFIRIHNRYLVNLNYVTKVESSQCICAEKMLPVSRGCKQNLAVAFAKMMLR
ncbi:MAG: LytTR family DNA-binding domain-containing protein [Lachnospiraceae bacterium]|nr:LytTR family DNA-binding domain-containing protein [Lachnospiraceae bacterium]